MRKSTLNGLTAGLVCLALGCGSGCSTVTSEKIDSYGKIAQSYYSHEDSARMLRVVAATNQIASITITGFAEIEMRAPTQPKTIIPREQSAVSGFWDAIKTVAPYAFMYGILTDGGVGSRSTSTVNNSATP